MTKEYPFTLLRETVPERDLFEDHTHENVADALATIIRDEKGGVTVGLEGSWGSGKSTVLHILKKKLVCDAYFFMFDAWAHEGDALRRVFLESLCDFFIDNVKDLHVKNELNAIKLKLDGRKTVTTSIVKRRPTGLGLWSIIVTMLTVCGAALVSVSGDAIPNCFPASTIKWIFLIGLTLSLSVIPLLLVNLIIAWRSRGFESIFKAESWSFLSDACKEETNRDVSEEEERSSVEFEEYFHRIIELATQQDQHKKLLLAIDNLDRINSEDSLKLWSTLQTFLQRRSYGEQGDEWFNKIWIIVPHDPDGLRRLWIKDGGDDAVAKSFLDKCFQLRLEVPKLIMSGWESFAKSEIESVLKAWPDGEKLVVLDTLRDTRANLIDIPTPREIKTYINQVAVLRNCAAHNIDTSVICYYTISRFIKNPLSYSDSKSKHATMSVEEVREALVEGKYPAEIHTRYFTSGYSSMFAGLLFGVDAQKGGELLLAPEITEAVSNKDDSRLVELERIHGNGFWMVFDEILKKMDFLGWGYLSELGLFCSVVKKASFEEAHLKELNLAAQRFVNYVNGMSEEQAVSGLLRCVGDSEAVAVAIDRIKQNSLPAVFERFYAVVSKSAGEILQNNEITENDLAKNLENILRAFPEELRKSVDCPKLEFSRLGSVFGKYDLKGSVLPDVFKPKIDLCTQGLQVSFAPGSEQGPESIKAIEYCLRTGLKFDWNAAVRLIREDIFFRNGYVAPNVPSASLLSSLITILVSHPELKDECLPLVRDWPFYNYVGHGEENRKHNAVVLLIMTDASVSLQRNILHPMQEVQNAIVATHQILTAPTDDNVSSVLDCFVRHDALRWVMNLISNEKAKLFDGILGVVEQDPTLKCFFAGWDLLSVVRAYLNRLKAAMDNKDVQDEKCRTLISYMIANCNFAEIIEEAVNDNIINYFDEIAYIVELGLMPDDKLELIKQVLTKLDRNTLEKAVGDSNFEILIKKLRETDNTYFLGYEYYRILSSVWCDESSEKGKKFREKLLQGNAVASWNNLVAFCKGEYRNELEKETKDAFKKVKFNDRKDYYAFNRNLLIWDEGDASFLKEVLWEILKSPGNGSLDMINAILSECNRHGILKFDQADKAKLKEPLMLLLEKSGNENEKRVYNEIAQIIGIDIPESAKSEQLG